MSLAVLVRFVIVVELQSVCLCPRRCGAGVVSIYRRLCLCARGGSTGHEGDGVPPGAGNGQLEAVLPPLNTSFQHRKLLSTGITGPLRTCLLVVLDFIHDGAWWMHMKQGEDINQILSLKPMVLSWE